MLGPYYTDKYLLALHLKGGNIASIYCQADKPHLSTALSRNKNILSDRRG